jgi:hypothetical protein
MNHSEKSEYPRSDISAFYKAPKAMQSYPSMVEAVSIIIIAICYIVIMTLNVNNPTRLFSDTDSNAVKGFAKGTLPDNKLLVITRNNNI